MNQEFLITRIDRVILVGKDEYNEQVTSFTHTLDSHELIFHFSGQSIITFNGKKLEVSENTIRFLPKGENREYIVDRKENGDCIDIFFDTDCPISEEAFVLRPEKSAAIGSLFKKIFSVWISRSDGYYFECISLIYKIFAELQKQNYIPDNQYQTIKPALRYIEEHFLDGKISMKTLADCCSVSYSYLKRLFIKKFGIPPTKYIIQLKINYACDLLHSGLYNITQIAEICGYSDIYFFSRQFKEYMGISPSGFVERYKSSK